MYVCTVYSMYEEAVWFSCLDFVKGFAFSSNLQSFAIPGMSIPPLTNVSFANLPRHALPSEFTATGSNLPSGKHVDVTQGMQRPAAGFLLCSDELIAGERFSLGIIVFSVLMFRFGSAFDCIFSHGNIFASCNFYSPWFGFKFPRIAAAGNDTAEHSASSANNSATGFFGDAILGCCGRSANSVFVEAAEKRKEPFVWASGSIGDGVNRIWLIPSFFCGICFSDEEWKVLEDQLLLWNTEANFCLWMWMITMLSQWLSEVQCTTPVLDPDRLLVTCPTVFICCYTLNQRNCLSNSIKCLWHLC